MASIKKNLLKIEKRLFSREHLDPTKISIPMHAHTHTLVHLLVLLTILHHFIIKTY